jgi:predicted porin
MVKVEQSQEENQKAAVWPRNSKAMQLYGQMRVSVDNHSGDWKSGSDGTSIVSNASRIGVKGAIPSGVADSDVIYQAEVRYETTDSVDGTAGKQLEFREGYGGLASPTWGKIRLGRLSTAYKSTLTKIDPWNDNAPQSRAGGRQGSSELHSSYFNNAVDYVTPKFFKAVTASVWYATEFDDDANPLHNTGTLKNFTGGSSSGVGLKYNKGPLFIGADYIDVDADAITKAGLANDNGWQIGGRYAFSAFSVAAFYEDVEDLGLGKNTYVNGIYKIGKTRLIAAYGINEDGAVYSNDRYKDWTLGAKYALNKKSELFAAYNSRINDTKDTDENTLTVGINAKFGY